MSESANETRFSTRDRNRTFVLGVLTGAVVAAMFSLALTSGRGQAAPQPTVTVTAAADQQAAAPATAQTQQRLPDLSRRTEGDPMALGPVDAPVVIIEYADYRCPYCSLFEQQTLPELVSRYVDAGLVRFEFRDMPIFGDQSLSTAVAGRAAGNQGYFWQFMSAIAANGVAEGGHPDLPPERILAFAEQAGVPDLDRFSADLQDPALLTSVNNDLAEARSLGASSVPAFIIGGQALLGAQPIDVFQQVIEQELDIAGVER